MKAFEVAYRDRPEWRSIYYAETASKARYLKLLDALDCNPDLTFADLTVRRAPEMDRGADRAHLFSGLQATSIAAVLDDERAAREWNAAHPVGTPVTVRLDGGEVRETVTRSSAAMQGGHTAVIWLEGVRGSYALSRVTPLKAGGCR